jgi:hypothetical protein
MLCSERLKAKQALQGLLAALANARKHFLPVSTWLYCQDVTSSEVTISYYVTDIELLFSTQPFMVAGKTASVDSTCTLVAPNRADNLALEPAGTATMNIPAKLAQRNLLIQVTVDGLSELVPYMPASINCTVRLYYT